MRRLLSCLLLLCLVPPSLAARDEKDEKKADEKKPDASPFIPVARLFGKVKSLGSADDILTLEVTYQYVEPNVPAQADYARRVQQILAEQQAIMNNRNPVQRQQQMGQLQREVQDLQRRQADLFKVREAKQDVRLELPAELKVRAPRPADAFDEKGNIRQYTAKELQELRGPEGLPGFPGGRENLQAGQMVVVVVALRRPDGPAARPDANPGPPMSPMSPGYPMTPMPPPQQQPLAALIVIVADPK
jgi:hypothetical protein